MDVSPNNCAQHADSHCLTQSQLMLWMGQQINPTSPLYNMALAFELRGKIEIDAFQAAFQALLQSSDILRMVFKLDGEEPVQHIEVDFNYQIPVLDWSTENEAAVQQKLEARSQQLFDLSTRLFDSILIKRAEDRYIWYLNQHHLTTDAWAMTVLYKVMANLYQKALNKQLDEVPEIPPFKDYIAYEQTARKKQTDAKKYWQEKVKVLPEWPHFYGHRERTMDSRSQRLRLDLGLERSNQLRALTKEVDLRSWTQHL
ncbi:MAG: condensation domain-containing protein, partial [Bacteroidota bacterium]